MARLSITTWFDAKEVAYGEPHQEITAAITAGSVQSAVLTAPNNVSGHLMRVRLAPDADCDVTWGTDPTAVAGTSKFMPANSVEYFGIKSGSKIAVIEHA